MIACPPSGGGVHVRTNLVDSTLSLPARILTTPGPEINSAPQSLYNMVQYNMVLL